MVVLARLVVVAVMGGLFLLLCSFQFGQNALALGAKVIKSLIDRLVGDEASEC